MCIATNQIDKMKFLGRFLLKNYFSEVFVKNMKKNMKRYSQNFGKKSFS